MQGTCGTIAEHAGNWIKHRKVVGKSTGMLENPVTASGLIKSGVPTNSRDEIQWLVVFLPM